MLEGHRKKVGKYEFAKIWLTIKSHRYFSDSQSEGTSHLKNFRTRTRSSGIPLENFQLSIGESRWKVIKKVDENL
jgi:hypothetical protein